jgi:heptosyltransferase-2
VTVKPRLLVLELWGLGDLAIATPFLRAASERFDVTLLAKPFALELAPRLWPQVEVIAFNAPWTAFRGKYKFWNWPWRQMFRLHRQLRGKKFDRAVSARWDPRDHLLLKFSGAHETLGFSRLKSRRYLTRELFRPPPLAHRQESWRIVGSALGLELPPTEKIAAPRRAARRAILVHTGARLALRVWPLENFFTLITRLREKNHEVRIACDPEQLAWWEQRGEHPACPSSVTALLQLLDDAALFLGNDSGPGHIAAITGIPTLTLFGPQLYEWFAPLHPAAVSVEGRACPYKPCSDYCRFSRPFCLEDVDADEVWRRTELFVEKNLPQR